MRERPASERGTQPGVVERPLRFLAFSGSSRCNSEEKNQDRFEVSDVGSALFAALCDGVTQSVASAEAATIICSSPPDLWEAGILRGRVELLRRRREELMASAPREPVQEASYLSRVFADITRDKYRQAFQTTLVAVRIRRSSEGGIALEAKTCGDSALLIFDRRGNLQRSNLQIEDPSFPFGHVSSVIEVLPDHFRAEEPNFTATIDEDAHVVLCSDGFYDAFQNPSALFRWLLLNGTNPKPAFEELHTQLDRYRGDDDISFVWLCPYTDDTPAAEPRRAAPTIASPRRTFAAMIILLRRCAELLARVFSALPGGGAS